MQKSGVSLTVTWPLRLCLLRVLLDTTTTASSFPLSKHPGEGDTAPTFSGLRVYLQFMWEVGLPTSCGVFLPLPLLQAFPLLVAGVCHCSCLLQLAWCEGFLLPTSSALRVPFPLCYVSFLLLLLVIQVFFFFFPGQGSVCPGGCADLAHGCLWEYRVPLSSPCGLHLPKPSGRCHLVAVQGPPGFSV
jgi:hypothetical protein